MQALPSRLPQGNTCYTCAGCSRRRCETLCLSDFLFEKVVLFSPCVEKYTPVGSAASIRLAGRRSSVFHISCSSYCSETSHHSDNRACSYCLKWPAGRKIPSKLCWILRIWCNCSVRCTRSTWSCRNLSGMGTCARIRPAPISLSFGPAGESIWTVGWPNTMDTCRAIREQSTISCNWYWKFWSVDR